MRTRALTVLATTTLALTALAVPAAQAADSRAADPDAPPRILKVTVNGGKDLVVGLSPKSFDVSVTASHELGITFGGGFAWWGDSVQSPYRNLMPDRLEPRCASTDPTTSACALRNTADPAHPDDRKDLTNEVAGPWKVYAVAQARNGLQADQEAAFSIKRAAKLTVNAAPEPVNRGADLTVTGTLTRADWDNDRYAGFTSRAVKLQFKKAGTTAWTTVKTVGADARGKVKTKVKASEDGTYRLAYGGARATGPATSTGDYVDVR
ncbi:calcium-binding protein [Streptomyces sp. JNUCC 64]